MTELTNGTMRWTEGQVKAARDALSIAEGACNSRGIARALVEAYDAWALACHNTDIYNRCPPALLILEQLVFLAGGMGTQIEYPNRSDRYYEATKQCEDIVL